VITERPYQSPQAPLSHEPVPPPERLFRLRVSTALLLAALAWQLFSGKRYIAMDERVHDSLLIYYVQWIKNIFTGYVLPALPALALVATLATAVFLVAQGRWRALPQHALELAVALVICVFPLNYLAWPLLGLFSTK
jgi:hypothetical protein